MKGILGGTFDPPHFGHLAMANAAHEQIGLDTVLLMVAGDPWQKADDPPSDPDHRLAMTALAAAEAEFLEVDDRELRRDGPTYTYDTVAAMGTECVLIVGADAAAGVPTWHRADELLEIARFAVVPRPGVDPDAVTDALGDRFSWLEMPPVDLSSTLIRAHVGKGYSARFLVPEAVASYIAVNGLYRSPSSSASVFPIIAGDE